MEIQTQQWRSSAGYIWSMLGSAIGFANLLGFGSQTYRNGGAAFLIPFTVALFILGIPMMILEGIIGQRHKEPLVAAYGSTRGRALKIFGWLAVCAVTTIGAFYTVLTGWSIAYTYYAGAGEIPSNTSVFFTDHFLHVTGSISDVGSLSLPVFFSTLFVTVFGWYVISRNIQKGIERWCSFFLPILTGLMVLFAAAVYLLPGSVEGFMNYLKPDFNKLYDLTIWRDVFGQLFFSLSLGLGIVVGYSRHTKSSTDIRKAMLIVALSDFAISFVSGLIIFGCLGYMAQQSGTSFDSVVESRSIFEIGYVIFPLILQSFGPVLSRVFGTLFFFSVFIAGFTGVFSIIESVVGNIRVEFGLSRKRAVTISLGMVFLMAIPFCFGNGTSLIDALEPMVLGNIMLIGGIAQIWVFMYLSKELRDDPVWYVGKRRHLAYYALRYVSPVLLVVSLFFALHADYVTGYDLGGMIRWMWLIVALGLSAGLSFIPKKRQNLDS